MRERIKIYIILIITLMYSCSTSNQVMNISEPTLLESSLLTANRQDSTRDSVVVNIPDNLTLVQQNLVNKADAITEDSVYILHLSEDGISTQVILLYEQTKVLMNIEDISKIYNSYLLIDILEELIDKYHIEGDISLSIVESLSSEVILLNDRITILNNELDNKDNIIASLDSIVAELRESNEKYKEMYSKQKDIIEMKDTQIKRHKRDKLLIAGGSGLVILLLIIFGGS